MHLIELRSGVQGHPVYRRIAQQMHQLIAEQAGHRIIAGAMSFVDYSVPDLERLEAERRSSRKREEASAKLPADDLCEPRDTAAGQVKEPELSCDAVPGN